ncbi:MAG: NADH-quinone oxidoreductase subunit C [Deltaproteobacteria bacterium]|nr:NADH-quinone oxidoreductase subunit C [Deltaproteobacteria bacterium]
MSTELAKLHNGVAVESSLIPELELDSLRAALLEAPDLRRRVAALFGYSPEGNAVELCAVLADDDKSVLWAGRARVSGPVESVTSRCPEAHLFERELVEQWGVELVGHPWLKPVRFPPSRSSASSTPVGVTDFYRVKGEEAHEVAVGPVHAGVIEPGHFRFQCHGEEVFHLEISLGYQHRGVERAMVGGPTKRTIHHVETLAGDTSIGHALAHCHAMEALSGAAVPARAQALRGAALELERLANHTGDLGALAGDVAFLPTASYCGRLRGDFLNMTAVLCGNRFGRGLVRPGGVALDVDGKLATELLSRLRSARRDVEGPVKLLWTTTSVQARFEGTGVLEEDVARSIGLVGVAARASGLRRDVRRDHPTGIYQFVQLPVTTWHTGDVFARAFVRGLEIGTSCTFVEERFENLPEGSSINRDLPAPRPDHFVVSLVEGWRGEICHVASTGADGRFRFYKIVDPSFHNWTGLAVALRGQQISDFPLCNKSFDLSYCGHDL